MPRNFELKARVPSAEFVRTTALSIGSEYKGGMNQVDTYFNVRSGRLKLRETDGRAFELIGYHRGELSERRLSDYAVVSLAAREPLCSILQTALGVRGVISKRRELFLYRSTRIHADEVEGLGVFVEFETVVHGSVEEAEEELKSCCELFGIEHRDIIKISYIDMLISAGVSAGIE